MSRLRKRDVVSRICAAVFGGYFAASAVSMLLARVIPFSRASATVAAILSTALLYLGAILWAFAARLPSRAWLVLAAVAIGASLLTGALIVLDGRS